MSLYTFSWFTKRKAPVLKRRPWWNVFGRDTIELREQWERISIHNIPKREATLLYDASAGRWESPLGTLLVRMMSNPLSIQLEGDGVPTPYVATTPVGRDAAVARSAVATPSHVKCPKCDGSGKEYFSMHDETTSWSCDRCGGAGVIPERRKATQSATLRRCNEAMADSVRGILQFLRVKPGATFKEVRQHCERRGDDLTWWPEWVLSADGYVTEQAGAMMLYEIMEIASRRPTDSGAKPG